MTKERDVVFLKHIIDEIVKIEKTNPKNT